MRRIRNCFYVGCRERVSTTETTTYARWTDGEFRRGRRFHFGNFIVDACTGNHHCEDQTDADR
jgi:hypothetical protein